MVSLLVLYLIVSVIAYLSVVSILIRVIVFLKTNAMHLDLKKLFDFLSSISILLSICVDKNFSITIEYFRRGPILIRHTFVTHYKLSGFVVPDLVIVHPPPFFQFSYFDFPNLYIISLYYFFFFQCVLFDGWYITWTIDKEWLGPSRTNGFYWS